MRVGATIHPLAPPVLYDGLRGFRAWPVMAIERRRGDFANAYLDRAAMSTLVKDLYEKYGIAAAAKGGLRLSPHVYNSAADIDLAIRAVGKCSANSRAVASGCGLIAGKQ